MLLPLQFAPHWQFLWQSTDIPAGGMYNGMDPRNTRSVPWERKANAIYWRGGASGFFAPASRQRPRYVHELRRRGHDVRFTSFDWEFYPGGYGPGYQMRKDEPYATRRDSKGWVTALERLPSRETAIDMDDVAPSGGPGGALVSHQHHIAMKHKYLLALESNDVPTQLKWLLTSGSVVVMPTPTTESWLMEGRLQPLVHYVPLDDPRRVDHALEWMRTHDAECKSIARAARDWMEAHFLLHRDACMKETTLDCITSPHLAEAILRTAVAAHLEFEDVLLQMAGPKADEGVG